MTARRLVLLLLFLASITALNGPSAHRVDAASQTLEFRSPPLKDPDKNPGPNEVPGWSALSVMFDGPVSNAIFIIDGACQEPMGVPNFMPGSTTVTLVPPPPFEGAPGYRIPVGAKVTLIIESDQPVNVKPDATMPGMAPTPNFWRYKGNNSDVRNDVAKAIPEPAMATLVATALPMLLAAGRRRVR